MSKTIKNTFLAAMATAVLCAGTVSARQLQSRATGFACRGSCTSATQCASGCICAFALEATTGFCSSHPTGVQPQAR